MNLLILFLSIFVTQITCDFKLIVYHTNDMHARFEETNALSGKCSASQAASGKCYGGFARVAQVVKTAKANEENVIFLNAGDTYQGTIWYTVHKWRIVADMIQRIGLDVMSLGNHEFDDDIAGLAPLLQTINIPVVTANVDRSTELSVTSLLKPSVVLTVGGRKVGVIGYLTPETKEVSHTAGLVITDEVASLREEVQRLREQGVNIIIAVGHSGYSKDQQLAREVEGIDLVVGGHSHTFLNSGPQLDSDVSLGPYPTLVTQVSGRVVPVVQAYAYTKYMGRVEVTFGDDGEMTAVRGSPILLDNSVPQDPGVLAALEPWRSGILNAQNLQVGQTRVFLNGSRFECRMRECNLGNLVADALVQYNAALIPQQGEFWTDASIAIQNGGGIRSSIDEIANNGFVTMEDVLGVLPFQNAVVKLQLEGRYLRQVLENSVAKYDKTGVEPAGRFLQFSGIMVAYNLSQPEGQRVKHALVRCSQCRVPTYQPIEDDRKYGIITLSFLADGGDGYDVIRDHAENRTVLDTTDSDVLADYFQRKSPVSTSKEARICLLK